MEFERIDNYRGSTGTFFKVSPGVVLKSPVWVHHDQTTQPIPGVTRHYSIERQILDRLGQHPRIVRYLGWRDESPTGLLLEQAHSSLQTYLNDHNATITIDTRIKWFRQAIESIVYIHSRGVMHGDMRPDNFLLTSSLDLVLCDFGKAGCKDLDIAGGLPDSGFYDPQFEWVMDYYTDLFSLGSVLYTILEGHWPYRGPGGFFESPEEMTQYESYVDSQFKQRIFPKIDGFRGDIILGCWQRKYANASDVLQALESESVV